VIDTVPVTRDEQFAGFVASQGDAVLRLARLLSAGPQDAGDLAQTTLMRCYAVWPRIADNPMPYARRVMANARTDRWRRHRDREHSAAEPAEQPGAWTVAAPDPVEQLADRDQLLRLLRRLTPRERAVVVLRYYLDLTEAQTAAELDLPLGTVKSIGSRALQRLRVAADEPSLERS